MHPSDGDDLVFRGADIFDFDMDPIALLEGEMILRNKRGSSEKH
jgi:hypothetical protein